MASLFNIHYNVSADELQGKVVLVFLKPQNPQRNYRIHAWQVPAGEAGAIVSFNYDERITTDVTIDGAGSRKVASARMPIVPGQLLKVLNPDVQSPVLQLAPVSLAQSKLTPEQCGIINQTRPYVQCDSHWYVDDHPVVTMPYVDSNMTVSFEYLPNFYFMVASPPLAGQTYIVQNFSDMTQYVLPVTATQVDVTLNCSQGLWRFDFIAS